MDRFVAGIVAIVGAIWLINYKKFADSIIEPSQQLWKTKKPTPQKRNWVRALVILICLALIIFGTYDALGIGR
jgi:hypothetical protein